MLSLTALGLVPVAAACDVEPRASLPAREADAGEQRYATRHRRGPIILDVTPKGTVDGRFVIDIRANTHSGDLADIDLAQAVALHVGGRKLEPVSAGKLSGHHSSADVAFDLAHAPREFSVTISGIRDQGTLHFVWP